MRVKACLNKFTYLTINKCLNNYEHIFELNAKQHFLCENVLKNV